MGNQQRTPEEEYRHYARPEPGRGGNWVEVLDDGRGRKAQEDAAQTSGPTEPFEPSSTGGNSDNGAVGPGGVRASTNSGPPAVPRRNLSLWGAWAVVALALVVGSSWLFGFFPSPLDLYQEQVGGPGSAPDAAWLSDLQFNLYTLGPFLIFVGLLGAMILLTVQATLFHRSRGED